MGCIQNRPKSQTFLPKLQLNELFTPKGDQLDPAKLLLQSAHGIPDRLLDLKEVAMRLGQRALTVVWAEGFWETQQNLVQQLLFKFKSQFLFQQVFFYRIKANSSKEDLCLFLRSKFRKFRHTLLLFLAHSDQQGSLLLSEVQTFSPADLLKVWLQSKSQFYKLLGVVLEFDRAEVWIETIKQSVCPQQIFIQGHKRPKKGGFEGSLLQQILRKNSVPVKGKSSPSQLCAWGFKFFYKLETHINLFFDKSIFQIILQKSIYQRSFTMKLGVGDCLEVRITDHLIFGKVLHFNQVKDQFQVWYQSGSMMFRQPDDRDEELKVQVICQNNDIVKKTVERFLKGKLHGRRSTIFQNQIIIDQIYQNGIKKS